MGKPPVETLEPTKDNPVSLHLTREIRQLPSHIEWSLAIIIGIFGGSTAVGAVYYVEASGWSAVAVALLLILGFSSIGFVVLAPSLALIAAALFTGRAVHQESFAVLWLTNITPKQIIDGYIEAVSYRLRILRFIGIGLIPQAIVILAYSIGGVFRFGPGSVGGYGPGIVFSDILNGCIPAIIVIVVLAVIGILMFGLAIPAGVWVGFLWPEKAVVVTGGILVVAWTISVLIPMLVRWGFLYVRDFNLLVISVFALIPILAFLSLARLAERGAYREVEKMRQRR